MLRFYQIVDHALRGVHPKGPPLTNTELARRLGYFASSIDRYLTGRVVPPDTKMELFAQVLDLPVPVLRQICIADRAVPKEQLQQESREFFERRDQAELAERQERASTDLYPIIKSKGV